MVFQPHQTAKMERAEKKNIHLDVAPFRPSTSGSRSKINDLLPRTAANTRSNSSYVASVKVCTDDVSLPIHRLTGEAMGLSAPTVWRKFSPGPALEGFVRLAKRHSLMDSINFYRGFRSSSSTHFGQPSYPFSSSACSYHFRLHGMPRGCGIIACSLIVISNSKVIICAAASAFIRC